tara:strand:+ start:44 stop:184 length:141 start_codon:yes stop_codon:yes gene_type:complete
MNRGIDDHSTEDVPLASSDLHCDVSAVLGGRFLIDEGVLLRKPCGS